ncbi:MAG: AAA family ATPase [Alphaproteobacteria bacterium]|nr:AAA family ATPase [Alphaproteobacteria bacterium]
MIKEIGFTNWKSFRDARLYIDPLTIIIGTNASGKSNALDGIEFLSRVSRGQSISAALLGDPPQTPIRGGVEWAAFRPGADSFRLSALVQGEAESIDYVYSIEVEVSPSLQLRAESLVRRKFRTPNSRPSTISMFSCSHSPGGELFTTAKLHRGAPISVSRTMSILSQLRGFKLPQAVETAVATVSTALGGAFIFHPVPARMRIYSPLADALAPDASNIAGVLAALPPERKTEIESIVSRYATELPDKDVGRVWAEPVGRLESDAMLYCEERWAKDSKPTIVDARGMSEGTLRFVAIVTALLTRPEGGLVVVEEIDNGLHPSRARLLLRMLREIGGTRNIDIVLTTHNPALLDALGPELLPFIVTVHRDEVEGDSRITPLENLDELPKLLAAGRVGQLATSGALDHALARQSAKGRSR